jgi:hypothetical protein
MVREGVCGSSKVWDVTFAHEPEEIFGESSAPAGWSPQVSGVGAAGGLCGGDARGPMVVLAPPSFLWNAVGTLGEGCSSGPAGRSFMIDLYIPASSSMNQKRGRLPPAEKTLSATDDDTPLYRRWQLRWYRRHAATLGRPPPTSGLTTRVWDAWPHS